MRMVIDLRIRAVRTVCVAFDLLRGALFTGHRYAEWFMPQVSDAKMTTSAAFAGQNHI